MGLKMKDKLLEIIEHYGVMSQLKYFQSEVFELNEAIIKHESSGGEYQHIVEEIADVMVMLGEFVSYYDIDNDEINNIMYQKIDRQLERIKNENIKQ